MTTVTVKIPDHLAAKLTAERVARQQLEAFLVGAVEAWLRRRQGSSEPSASWDGAFENSSADFVERLIEDNRELFEELAKR